MIKSRTINGMRVELLTGNDASMTSEIRIDGTLVGCDAIQRSGCDDLFDELTKDKTGEKARYLLEYEAI